jgi:hypothetical protein
MKLAWLFLMIQALLLANGPGTPTPREAILASKGHLKLSALFDETPVLPIEDVNAEIYRITIVPAFYPPVTVRVEKHQARYVLVAKRLSGQGGFDVGTLQTQKQRGLRSQEWDRLRELLNAADYWELPFVVAESAPNRKGEMTVCLDGSEWTLEGVRRGRFHVVSRNCPPKGNFTAIGKYLITLSGPGGRRTRAVLNPT